jgi:hypothetical protein
MVEKEKLENIVPDGVEHDEVYLAALKVLDKATKEEPMKVGELLSKIEKSLEETIKSYLIYRDLNAAAQDSSSRIRSRKGRNGGYFIAPLSSTSLEEKTLSKSEIEKEKTLEQHLWPLVALWLKQVKRLPSSSHEVANLKRGGKWSNPDVVGLNPIEELGFFDVEITTVEVKPTLVQWRQFFFEAVSHKRFSERVYFIYRTIDQDTDEDEELRKYAEKYNVGLVKMELSEDDYKSLTNWKKLTEEDKINLLDYFVELMPAPFEAISIRDKITFLRQIGISNKSELYSFGA